MEFRNLTPFSTLCYKMLDTQNTEHHVVAMKVGFLLERTAGGAVIARIMEDPVMSLCMQDECSGLQVLQESDLSPFKPRSDVIVNGTACAPDGIPVAEIPVSLRLLTADRQVLLDKQCLVTGERFFIHHPLTGQWSLSEPEPFISLPLHYQYAFGGGNAALIKGVMQLKPYRKNTGLHPNSRQNIRSRITHRLPIRPAPRIRPGWVLWNAGMPTPPGNNVFLHRALSIPAILLPRTPFPVA
ncbi:DUF2169 domain-containing protein [Escherichia coli]|uniref:DUF2169 domain-containing protein n=1 Tax=Escherichia coli TaxID=562 RepID=UPI000A9DA8E8|nr:DUF2169 domain-containing protein [Escherichia coli]